MTREAYTAALGEWIRNERVELGLKQQDVAEAVGVTDATLSNWERGLSVISSYNERRLRAYFKDRRSEPDRQVTA